MIKGFIRLHKLVSLYCINNKLNFSQHEIKKNITNFGVNINSVLHFSHLDKVLTINEPDINHWPQRQIGNFKKLNILYENDEFMAIFKPTNTVVEAGSGNLNNNIIEYFKNLDKNLFCINRLDKNTSGLMLLAKSEQWQEKYQNLFRNRQVEKEYLALVVGKFEKIYNIKHYQIKDKKNILKQKGYLQPPNTLSQEELLKYRECKTILKPYFYCQKRNLSLIKVKLETGRMHQIRVISELLGYPLYKDAVYNSIQNIDKNLGVFANFEEVSEVELLKFINAYYKNACQDETEDFEYFLSSYLLAFTDGQVLQTSAKNYSFNLLL